MRLLLNAGQAERASEVVRIHRVQYLAGLYQLARLGAFDAAESARWARGLEGGRAADVDAPGLLDDAVALFGGLPSATPRLAAPGELLLSWFETDDGWLGFATTPDGVRAVELGPVRAGESKRALSDALLGPFAPEIAAAHVITLLPDGALEPIDLHTLPVDGAPLLAARPVRYGLDLASEPPSDPPPPRTALLVYDPDDSLLGALREGRAVTDALGPTLHASLTWPAATRTAILGELGRVDLLHYAGHAVSGSAAFGGALAVADGELSGAHVVAGQAPAVVVLSACDGSRGRDLDVSSLGLAQAFLAAGSQAVLATERPLDDHLGAALADALYARVPELGWAEGWRQAVLALEDREADAFRLYGFARK